MTITDATPADLAAIFYHSPVPVELLRGGMAVLVNGEWFAIDDAYWHEETGRHRLIFTPGSSMPGASYTPEETVWAYPDAQRIADLAYTIAETSGHTAPDLQWQLSLAERHATASAAERDHWLQLAARDKRFSPEQLAAFAVNAAAYEADREESAARAAQLRAELAAIEGSGDDA